MSYRTPSERRISRRKNSELVGKRASHNGIDYGLVVTVWRNNVFVSNDPNAVAFYNTNKFLSGDWFNVDALTFAEQEV